jgi:sugar phosphate permease
VVTEHDLERTNEQVSQKNSVWTSRRSIAAHVALAIWFPGCIVATWWQVNIALSGDDLGWAYSIMWPCFAVFGVVFWWYLVHDDPDTVGARGLRSLQSNPATSTSELDDDSEGLSGDELIKLAEAEDPELAEYNRYLAELSRRNAPKTWTGR